MSAKPQPNSGAGPIHKEDAKNGAFLFQIKSAVKAKSITVKKEDLETLRYNAIDVGLLPAFVLDFRDGNEWVAIQRRDLDSLASDANVTI